MAEQLTQQQIEDTAEMLVLRMDAESHQFPLESTSFWQNSEVLDEVPEQQLATVAELAFDQACPLVRAQMVALFLLYRCRFRDDQLYTKLLLDTLVIVLKDCRFTVSSWKGLNDLDFVAVPTLPFKESVSHICAHAIRPLQIDMKSRAVIEKLLYAYLLHILGPVVLKLMDNRFSHQQATHWVVEQQKKSFVSREQLDRSLAQAISSLPRSRNSSPTRK